MYSSMLYKCNSYIDDIHMLHSTGPSASGPNDCPLIKDTPNMGMHLWVLILCPGLTDVNLTNLLRSMDLCTV